MFHPGKFCQNKLSLYFLQFSEVNIIFPFSTHGNSVIAAKSSLKLKLVWNILRNPKHCSTSVSVVTADWTPGAACYCLPYLGPTSYLVTGETWKIWQENVHRNIAHYIKINVSFSLHPTLTTLIILRSS